MEDIKLQVQDETLSIGGLRELTAANATIFRDRIRSAMSDSLRNIEIDMSQAVFVDSSGLATLIALRKTARSRHGRVRLVNPRFPVERILEMTRMPQILEITRVERS